MIDTMGRKRRTWVPTHFYHIACRGNRRESLFRDDGDFLTYLYILRKVHEKYPFELAAFCLMTNHLHLQLRSKEVPISKIMSLINKRYANYFNNKYRLTGHVFEKRFYDKIISTKEGMLQVGRYIHLNPVEAKMVKAPDNYRWSSYRYYIGQAVESPPYLTFLPLGYFPGSLYEKRKQYREYHAEMSEETKRYFLENLMFVGQ